VAVVRGAARFFSPLRLVSAAALLAAVGIAVLILDFGGNPPTPAGGAGGARTGSRAAQIMSGLPAADPAAVLPGRVFVDSGSVAVLPFAAPSGSDASGVSYRDFATDLYRGVVAELRALPAVYVVAAPSVYGSAGLAPWEIGAQLGTRGIVTGSVEVVDDSVAMAMTLRDAATNAVLWEMRYEQPLGDAVAVRADVVEHIATALVDPEQRARAAAVDARADNRVTSVPPAIAASE
jgi:TolB-like protein